MSTRLARAGLTAACAALLTAAHPGQEAVTLTVAVTALDRTNTPVTGLAVADVRIQEDGAARIVTGVRQADDPMAVAVLVDTARAPMGAVPPTVELRRAVTVFVDLVLADHPASRIALLETGGAAVTLADFTNQRATLDRAAERLWQSERTSVVVLEALEDVGARIAEQPSRRRAIVVLDFDSQDTSQEQLDRMSGLIQQAGASVWAVSVRSQNRSSVVREGALAFLTNVTGGLWLTAVTPTSLESQCRTIARALTSQYLVTYERPVGARPAARVQAVAARAAKVLTTRIVQ